LKAAVGLGLAWPSIGVVLRCTTAHAQTDPAAQVDPKTARPQENDQLVLAVTVSNPELYRSPGVVTAASVPLGGPPVAAFPMDPRTKVVRDGSRLNEVVLIRLDPRELADETRARAADGIVAYSAICTHTGCDIWDWQRETKTMKCPCHFSTFDVKDAARVLDGPAPRRLPALPVKLVEGVVTVARGFVTRPGFQQGGA
jgi:Rieske Fe-S protein